MKINVGSKWRCKKESLKDYPIITKVGTEWVSYRFNGLSDEYSTLIDSFLKEFELDINSRILNLDLKIKKIKAAL